MSIGARQHNPHFPGLATPFLTLSTQDTPCSPEPLALAQRGANSSTSLDHAGQPWRPLGHIWVSMKEEKEQKVVPGTPPDSPNHFLPLFLPYFRGIHHDNISPHPGLEQ